MKAAGRLSDRISLLVDEAGSARRFAEIAGVQNPTVLGWMNGSIPYARNLRQLCERTGVSIEWLRDGRGDQREQLETFAEATRGIAHRRWQEEDEEEAPRLKDETAAPYGTAAIVSRHLSDGLLADIIGELSSHEKLSSDERLRLQEPFQHELHRRIRARSIK